MKSLIKKLIRYDVLYHHIKSSIFYHAWKKINGDIANALHGNPTKNFFVIWVTWTNGKTTVVNMLHCILNPLVSPSVMVSTALIKIWNQTIRNEKKMTSLDVYDLYTILETAKKQWCKVAILETSSHGLDQLRFEGIDFDCAVLTNITLDHFDYHGTMEDYVEAKKKLFLKVLKNSKANKYASFPFDDQVGRKRYDEMPFEKKISFGLQHSAVLKAEDIKESLNGTTFTVNYLGNKYEASIPMLGSFNVQNALAALSVSVQIGVDMKKAIDALRTFEGVPGRLQALTHNDVHYYVDFAHSPDALEKTLWFLAPLKGKGELITMFGAPGLRDKSKRPIMGEIVQKYSDISIVTDDDPDTEDSLKIIQQITAGMTDKKPVYIIPERHFAMKYAIEIAQPGDVVVFAGKGHETIQLTNFWKRKRNDMDELKKLVK